MKPSVSYVLLLDNKHENNTFCKITLHNFRFISNCFIRFNYMYSQQCIYLNHKLEKNYYIVINHYRIDGLRDYFEKFGPLEQVEIVSQPRGYGI